MVAVRTPPFSPFRSAPRWEAEYDSKETRRDSMGKSVQDVMTTNPTSVMADNPVVEAARIMKEKDVGIVPVVEGGRLVGTVTDRDIAVRVVAEGKDPQSVRVREIASTDVVTVDP